MCRGASAEIPKNAVVNARAAKHASGAARLLIIAFSLHSVRRVEKNVATHPDFPFIVVSPQCPDRQVWSPEVLLGLLDDCTAKYVVDKSRIYLTGLSMGGYGTWDLDLTHPERFAAIVPICGGGQMIAVLLGSQDRGAALRSVGVWAFHGGKDPVVPLEESQRMVDALKRAGAQDVKLTIYPDAGHDSWVEAYNNPELYGCMLKHSRKQ